MQLPGMHTDLVRLSLDVTWDPVAGEFAISRRLWTKPQHGNTWLLEDMATTGTPLALVTLRQRWPVIADGTLGYFLDLVERQGEPF